LFNVYVEAALRLEVVIDRARLVAIIIVANRAIIIDAATREIIIDAAILVIRIVAATREIVVTRATIIIVIIVIIVVTLVEIVIAAILVIDLVVTIVDERAPGSKSAQIERMNWSVLSILLLLILGVLFIHVTSAKQTAIVRYEKRADGSRTLTNDLFGNQKSVQLGKSQLSFD
jgi:hypothetical protein